jgi:hypothetical protein
MLLAFSAKPEELDILMLSLTFGNVEVQKYVAVAFSNSFDATFKADQGQRLACIKRSTKNYQKLTLNALQLLEKCRHALPLH